MKGEEVRIFLTQARLLMTNGKERGNLQKLSHVLCHVYEYHTRVQEVDAQKTGGFKSLFNY